MDKPILWNDDLFPPLDIAVVSRAIGELWLDEMRKLETRHGEPLYMPIIRDNHIADRIAELLKAYDEGRTRTLQFYKEELIRLHRVMPTAPFVLP